MKSFNEWMKNYLNENSIKQELITSYQPQLLKRFVDDVIKIIYQIGRGYPNNYTKLFDSLKQDDKKVLAEWVVYNAMNLSSNWGSEENKYNTLNLEIDRVLTGLNAARDFLAEKIDQDGNLDSNLVIKFSDPKFGYSDLTNMVQDHFKVSRFKNHP